ncbi:hypothetical protein HN51_025733 [Arachis hypogaea]
MFSSPRLTIEERSCCLSPVAFDVNHQLIVLAAVTQLSPYIFYFLSSSIRPILPPNQLPIWLYTRKPSLPSLCSPKKPPRYKPNKEPLPLIAPSASLPP